MVTVKVKVTKDVAERLSLLAKEKDYATREEFLRALLLKISLDDFQLESDKRYEDFIKEILEKIKNQERVINANTEILERIYELEVSKK